MDFTMQAAKNGGNSSTDELTFVYGALRSGTTVFRLMLDANKNIRNFGEVDYLFDFLKMEAGRYVIDRDALRSDRIFQHYFSLEVPASESGVDVVRNLVDQLLHRAEGQLTLNIHRNIDKVAIIFPETKIIHIVRDPRDVAKSSIGMGWAGNTYFGVDHWIETENEWSTFGSAFDRERVCEVFFEKLIADPIIELTRVCNFLGVPFSTDMLKYGERTPYGPPDSTAIQRWKKLPPRDAALVEFRAKKLLLERNYELSGYPLTPPSLREKISLVLENTLLKWKFGVSRYGYLNYIMEKVAKRISKRLHTMFRQRMNEIDRTRLAATVLRTKT